MSVKVYRDLNASMGYSVAEARVGLRSALGDRKLAVDHILKRREEK